MWFHPQSMNSFPSSFPIPESCQCQWFISTQICPPISVSDGFFGFKSSFSLMRHRSDARKFFPSPYFHIGVLSLVVPLTSDLPPISISDGFFGFKGLFQVSNSPSSPSLNALLPLHLSSIAKSADPLHAPFHGFPAIVGDSLHAPPVSNTSFFSFSASIGFLGNLPLTAGTNQKSYISTMLCRSDDYVRTNSRFLPTGSLYLDEIASVHISIIVAEFAGVRVACFFLLESGGARFAVNSKENMVKQVLAIWTGAGSSIGTIMESPLSHLSHLVICMLQAYVTIRESKF